MRKRKEVLLFLNGPRKLSGEEMESMFGEYRRTGNMEIEKEILMGSLWIIAMVLSEYAPKVEDQEFGDLGNEGFIGLMHAVENYRPEVGPFVPYATKCIRGRILTYIDGNNLLTIPRRLKKKVRKITDLLEQGLNIGEIALELGMPEEEVLRALKTAVKAEPVESVLPYEEHAGVDISAEDKWFKEEMGRFLTSIVKDVLKERNADIVLSAYGIGRKMSLKEIAEKHHLTEQRVGQILKESVPKLREAVRSSGYD